MKTSRIQILYPERRSVSLDQVQRWAADDLANEEERSPVDWRTIPIEYAIAVVSHHGSVTIADTHGLTIPEYDKGDPIPGVKFTGVCRGHEPGPMGVMGITQYCDGRCRPPGGADIA